MFQFKCLAVAMLSLITASAYAVPPNARATANGWECNTGFKRQAQQCNKIFVPPNAVLRGQGWVCRSGFTRVGQQCNKASGAANKNANNNFFGDLLDKLKEGDKEKKKAVEAAVKVYRQGKFKQAMKMFEPLAKRSSARAQFYMGLMYGRGEGVLKDPKKSAEWMFKSAKRNYSFAQFLVGNFYRTGTGGVAKNDKQAVYWYQKSAKQGHRAALHYLGLANYYGRGVLKDEQRGLDFIRQAGLKGNREAQYFLGVAYCTGEAVILSKRQCAIWIKRAYEAGHPRASRTWEKYRLWEYK